MSLDIASLIILLLDTLGVMALIASVIYMYRKDHEKYDTAAQERRTIIDRIERLRKENNNRTTVNYFLFNHSRNQIVEKALAYVTPDGGYKIIGEPLQILAEYIAREVDVFVILKGGDEVGDFLGALQTDAVKD